MRNDNYLKVWARHSHAGDGSAVFGPAEPMPERPQFYAVPEVIDGEMVTELPEAAEDVVPVFTWIFPFSSTDESSYRRALVEAQRKKREVESRVDEGTHVAMAVLHNVVWSRLQCVLPRKSGRRPFQAAA